MPRFAGRARAGQLAAAAAGCAAAACLGTLAAPPAGAVTLPPIDPGSVLPGLPSTHPGAQARCPGAHRLPAGMTARRARAVMLCVVNRARAAHGLPAFRPIRSLRVAAGRHAADMVRRHYFAHVRPGGPDLLARLRSAGWSGVAYGEAIAWGCGSRSTARATLHGWLNSPLHRAILLSPLYRQVGLGVARRAPSGGCRGATWVLDAARG
jgi:uncharacterized protein YkwD